MERFQKRIGLLVLGLIAITITNCSRTPPSTSIPQQLPPVETDTPTPQIEPANTPTKEAASQPREAGEDGPEIAPSRESQLNENGPWLVYAAFDGIYGFNPDGSGLTKLDSFGLDGPGVEHVKIAAPSQGEEIAVLQVDAQERLTLGMPRLRTYRLPYGSLVLDTWLIPIDWEEEDYASTEGMSDQERFEYLEKMPLEQLFAAIGTWNEIQWSHDGSMLTFNAALDGSSADLYLYNTETLDVTRLTDGPSHSVNPVFTLDDEYILHGAAEFLNWGYSGAGYDYLHTWAAKTDGSSVVKVFDHEFYGREKVLGWLSDTTYVAASWENWCYFFDLRVVDILKGEEYSLYSGSHNSVAVAPEADKVFFSVTAFGEGGECKVDFEPGAYLMDISDREWVPLTGIDPEAIHYAEYNPAAGAFFIIDSYNNQLEVVQPNGLLREFPSLRDAYDIRISFSPDGQNWMMWDPYGNQVAFGGIDSRFETHLIEQPSNPVWLPNGSAVLFFGQQKGVPALFIARMPKFLPEVLIANVPKPFYFQNQLVLVEP